MPKFQITCSVDHPHGGGARLNIAVLLEAKDTDEAEELTDCILCDMYPKDLDAKEIKPEVPEMSMQKALDVYG